MSNIIFSVIYLQALLDVLKAALKVKVGCFALSKDRVEEFGDESLDRSDLEIDDEVVDQDIVIRFASDWKISFDGIYEARFYVGQVPEGFILGSEESYMGGDCEVSWPSDKYYLDFEVAKSVLFNMIEEWIRGDIEQSVAHAA